MNNKPLLIFITLVVIFAFEALFPLYRRRQSRIMRAFPHILTAIMSGLLMKLVLVGLTIKAIGWVKANPWGLMHMLSLSLNTVTVIVFVLFDVCMYFWHIINHRVPFLWRFNHAHHSDIAMDTTTALRFHPGELVLSTLIRLPVVILLCMSFDQLVLFEILLNLSTRFHHSNLAIPEKCDRRLRVFIVTLNVHRVHHSVERTQTNSNFASLLSVWDRLNRTFKMREDTLTITTGLPLFRKQQWQRLWGFLITPLSEDGTG